MKRLLSIILCLTMLVGFAPAASYAQAEPGTEAVCSLTEGCVLPAGHEGDCQTAPSGEPSPEPTVEPAVEPTVEPAVEPTVEPTVEPAVEPTVEPNVEPTVEPTAEPEEELNLSFSGFDHVSETGDAYYMVPAPVDEVCSLQVNAQSNGQLSFSWEKLDAETITYASVDPEVFPGALSSALDVTASQELLDIEGIYRCAVTASLDENALIRYAYFTLEAPVEELFMGSGAVELFQQGAFPNPPSSSNLYLGDTYTVQDAIRAGISLENYREKINIGPFRINEDELYEYFQDIVNTDPMFFYLTGAYTYSYNSYGYIIDFYPKYSMTQSVAQAETAQVEAEISNILACVDDSMSVVGKMLAVNDYFAVNYQYDLSYSNYNIYNLFVEKTAVCQGYALGYHEIMKRLNIDSDTVTSDAMNHIWNIVYVDGSWYHVDVTWNDPTNDVLGRACHNYFLVSDSAMLSSRNHYSWVSNEDALNTKYDNYFWTNIDTPFAYAGGNWYYVDNNYCTGGGYTNINSCSLTSATGSRAVVKPCNFAWTLGSYYGLSGCGSLSGGVVVNSGSAFYKYYPSTGALRKIAQADTSGKEVVACYTHGSSIVYGVAGSDGKITVKSLTPAYVDSVSVTSYTDKLLVGGQMTMSAETSPDSVGPDGLTWSVTNGTGSATISESGVLTGVTSGQVTVVATENTSGISGSKTITILSRDEGTPVKGVTMSWPAERFIMGSSLQLSASVAPDNATNPALVWSITDGSAYASIDQNGLLTAAAPCTVTVKVSATDGSNLSDSHSFQVLKPVTGITVSSSASTLSITSSTMPTMQMTTAVAPSDATDKSVTWSVINGTGAATIDSNGLLTGSTPGTVTVRATANDGTEKYGEKTLTIINKMATAVKVTPPSTRITVGSLTQLKGTTVPTNAVNNTLSWSIASGSEYADLTAEGVLTAQAPGVVRVRATAFDSTICGELDIEIFCDYTYTETADAVTITGYTGTGASLTVPETINRKPVTVFGSGTAVFSSPKVITRVNLPSQLTAIGDNALSGCIKLTGTLVLPSTLQTIGDSAFQGCNKLTGALVLPSTLQSIGSSAFQGCYGFTGILDLPDSLTSIGDNAFNGCNRLTGKLVLPSTLQTIGDSAFKGCYGFTGTLELPENITSLGNSAFYGCNKLSGVLDIPESLESIGNSAFYGCVKLTGLTLPSGLTAIGSNAFFGCTGLRGTLELPSTLLTVGDKAFYNCSGLVGRLELPASVTSIGSKTFWGSGLKEFSFAAEAPAFEAADTANASFPLAATLLYYPSYTTWTGTQLRGYTIEPFSITVSAPMNLAIDQAAQLTAASNLSAYDVTWSVESGGEAASINAETGMLSGIAEGTVTVRATDTQSGIYGEAQINVVTWNIEIFPITGAAVTELTAGQILNLKAGYIPEDLTAGAFQWSLREEDKAYATIAAVSGGVRITAKNTTTEAHDIVVTASSAASGPEAGTYTLSILPKADSVAIQRADIAVIVGSTAAPVQTIVLDTHGEGKTIPLAGATWPAAASDAIKWQSSSTAIATVSESGLVTGIKPGVVTIKATAADGSGKYASVKVQVIYADPSTKFTTSSGDEPVPAIGMQRGYTTTMQVYGEDKTTPMDASLFTYSISASQQAIATVDADTGVITAGAKAGTATVTAALKEDPLKRKATLSVKVIPLQTDRLILTPVASDAMPTLVMLDADGNVTLDENLVARYEIAIDKSDIGTGSGYYNFTISPTGKYSDGTDIAAPALSYVSSDTRIATVSVAKSGTVTVAVKRASTAVGECVITGTSKDLAKISSILTIKVRDYSPRMGASSLTLNPKLADGVSTSLLSSYGNTVQTVELFEYNSKTRAYDTPSTRISASFVDDTLTIKPQGMPANASIKTMILVRCDNGEYTLPLTVTVKSAEPAFTIKQSGKFNLFYGDSTAVLTATAKGCDITGIALDTHPVFKGDCDLLESPQSLTLSYLNGSDTVYAAKPNLKLTLLISVDGYSEPIRKAVTLSAVTTKPSLYLSASSSVINTAQGDRSVSFTVIDKASKEPLTLGDGSYTLSKNPSNTFIQDPVADAVSNAVTLTLTGTAGGTASVSVQNDSWLLPITLSHKISVLTTLPTAKLRSSTLKLSNIYTAITADTSLTLSQSSLSLKGITYVSTAKSTALPEAEKLELSYADGIITASIKDGETPKAGTYGFKVTSWLEGQTADDSDDIALGAVTLNVSVAATAPKMSLVSSTLKLNSLYLGEVASSGVKLSLGGYELTGINAVKASTNKLTGEPIDIYLEEGVIKATLNEAVARGTYSYVLTPTVKHTVTAQEADISPVTLKVTVYSSTSLSATVAASGKLDAVNRDGSGITYTVTKLNNIIGTLQNPQLLGADADKFVLSELAPNAKGQPTVTLKLKADEEYKTNVTYKLQLGFDVEGIDGLQVKTSTLSVKVTQSSLKLSVTPTAVTVYQSHDAPINLDLNVLSPLGVELASVAVNPKTVSALRLALSDEPLTFTPDSTGATVTLDVENAAYLKVGSSYVLLLDVTPEGMATNLKPTQVKVIVKCYK